MLWPTKCFSFGQKFLFEINPLLYMLKKIRTRSAATFSHHLLTWIGSHILMQNIHTNFLSVHPQAIYTPLHDCSEYLWILATLFHSCTFQYIHWLVHVLHFWPGTVLPLPKLNSSTHPFVTVFGQRSFADFIATVLQVISAGEFELLWLKRQALFRIVKILSPVHYQEMWDKSHALW